MSHYQKHIFLCVNQKVGGKRCCAQGEADEMAKYLKLSLMEKGLHGPDKYRVSTSGCLGRCAKGPCLVIYPDAVWYTYNSQQDIDRIIDEHLLNNKILEELLIR